MFGLLSRVDGFNGGNGHIKYLSNCLQHAVSATDSLLINVENCSVSSASAGQQLSCYFQLSFSPRLLYYGCLIAFSLRVCFFDFQMFLFPILERAVRQFIKPSFTV